MKALLFISLYFFASAERIAKRIYKPVEGSVGCFRRFNGTHQFGCSSRENGNVGVLHKIQSEDDLKWLIEIGPHSPYVALLSTRLFQREMMTSLKESGKVNGVVVLNKTGEGRPERFSIDDVCPNHYSSFYYTFEEESQFCDTNPWNPGSTEFLFEDWGFPIFFVQSIETAENISQCYEKYNRPSVKGIPRDWPLCAIELKSPMIGAVNTPTCIRRGILDSYINPQPNSLAPDVIGIETSRGFIKRPEKGHVRILGVLIDENPSFRHHIASVETKLSRNLDKKTVTNSLKNTDPDLQYSCQASHSILFYSLAI